MKIVPRVTGYLIKTLCKEGQIVRPGDKLFEIDPRPYQAEVDQARAEFDVAEARKEQANVRLAQANDANKNVRGAVDSREIDGLLADVRAAHATVQATAARLRSCELSFDDCTVKSPIGGELGRFNLSEGNLITKDQTVLTTVVSRGPMRVSFPMDERTLLRIRRMAIEGIIKQPENGGLPISVGLPDENGYPHPAIVSYIGDHIDPQTGTVLVQAVLNDPALDHGNRLLTPGMNVNLQVQIGPPRQAILVNSRAFVPLHAYNLFVLGADNTLERRNVTVGEWATENLREVISGVLTSDSVFVGSRPAMSDQWWSARSHKLGPMAEVKLMPMTDIPNPNDSQLNDTPGYSRIATALANGQGTATLMGNQPRKKFAKCKVVPVFLAGAADVDLRGQWRAPRRSSAPRRPN